MTQAETDGAASRRPLSPHLTVYKPMMTMAMSVAHRISGAAIYLGAALIAVYLLALAFGPAWFSAFSWIGAGLLGHLILPAFVWALYHHLLGGVRHALWDRGLFMDPRGRELLATGTLIGGVALTALTFIFASLAG